MFGQSNLPVNAGFKFTHLAFVHPFFNICAKSNNSADRFNGIHQTRIGKFNSTMIMREKSEK